MFLAAITGVGGQQVPAIPTQAPSAPLGSAPLVKTPTVTPAFTPNSDADRFRTWRLWGHVLSSTLAQDHEDAGTMIYPNNAFQYTGIYAQHIVYPDGNIRVRLPPNATGDQILYAATTRAPNGSCLEVGTAYIATIADGKTTPVLYVYNFCDPKKGSFAIPPTASGGLHVDETFMATYARDQVKGLPAYEVRIFTAQYPITAQSMWYAELHNQKSDTWDLLYSYQGMASDPRGWSIFETYYQQGLCSESLPVMGADQIALFNISANRWELLSGALPQYHVMADTGGKHNNNCFVDDSTGPASYQLLPVPPVYYSWNVRSR
jgi:hypothetical protein